MLLGACSYNDHLGIAVIIRQSFMDMYRGKERHAIGQIEDLAPHQFPVMVYYRDIVCYTALGKGVGKGRPHRTGAHDNDFSSFPICSVIIFHAFIPFHKYHTRVVKRTGPAVYDHQG